MWNFSNKQNNIIRIDTLHDKKKEKTHIHPTNNMFWLSSKCQIITLEIKFPNSQIKHWLQIVCKQFVYIPLLAIDEKVIKEIKRSDNVCPS